MNPMENLEYSEQELNDYRAIAESVESRMLKRRYKESLRDLKFQEFVNTLKFKRSAMINGAKYGMMGGAIVGFVMSTPFVYKTG